MSGTRSLNTVWFDYLERVSRISAPAIRPYGRAFAALLGKSSALRAAAGEYSSNFHRFSRDQIIDIPTNLDFEYDDVAESAGPRSAPIPAGWPKNDENPPALQSIDAPPVGKRELKPKHVMYRVENDRLSVTLVNLGDFNPVNDAPPKGGKRKATPAQVRASPGESATYRLKFSKGNNTTPISVSITTRHTSKS